MCIHVTFWICYAHFKALTKALVCIGKTVIVINVLSANSLVATQNISKKFCLLLNLEPPKLSLYSVTLHVVTKYLVV